MHIKFISESCRDKWDYLFTSYEIIIDDEQFMFFQECDVTAAPEDNTLDRNFSDVYRIPELIEKVVDAINSGETITYETEKLATRAIVKEPEGTITYETVENHEL